MERIKVDDCFSRFRDEWVCLHVEDEEPGHVIGGRLIAHSHDEDEVLRAARQCRDVRGQVPTYVFFAGPLVDPRANAIVILWSDGHRSGSPIAGAGTQNLAGGPARCGPTAEQVPRAL